MKSIVRIRSFTGGAALAVLAAAAGCSSAGAPQELKRARSAYEQAARGPAASLDPTGVHRAGMTLQAAEQSYRSVGDTQDTRDLAYTAERHAETAQVHAGAIAAIRERDEALARAASARDSELAQTRSQLDQANAQLSAQRQQTQDAERRAEQARSQLATIATVRQRQQDVVITLTGSVIFASGKAELLPEARTRLNHVAGVLAQNDRQNQIDVRGFTDSVGSDSLNKELSQRRADAVRDFLASHGVPSDHLTAEGLGKADPVADNSTPEGRANNRRVEIVVQPPSPTGSR